MDQKTFNDEQIKPEDGIVEQELPKEKTRIKFTKKWRERSRASKAATITAVVLFAICLIAVVLTIFCRQIFGDEFGDKIYGPGVDNGFVALWNSIVENRSAIFYTFIAIFIAMIVKLLVDLIVNLLSHRTKRGRTVGSLIKSLFKYLIVIITIGIVLSLWGVNVAGIIAGVGILTLIIGLGCQSLVNDIVSGIFIVTDSYFEVGDIVIIDGFRGTVVSVGLRTTKIRDWCNNIKSIANSKIDTVVNVSRYSSNALVYFTVPFDKDLRKVESIVQANMDRIEKNIQGLKGKIIYKGICEVTEKGAKMFFCAPCLEDDKFQVERDLLRELYIIFADNNIGYAYNQIQLNKERDGSIEKASAEDVKKSAKLNELAHTSTNSKRTSKKIVNKMVKSLVEEDTERDDEEA